MGWGGESFIVGFYWMDSGFWIAHWDVCPVDTLGSILFLHGLVFIPNIAINDLFQKVPLDSAPDHGRAGTWSMPETVHTGAATLSYGCTCEIKPDYGYFSFI